MCGRTRDCSQRPRMRSTGSCFPTSMSTLGTASTGGLADMATRNFQQPTAGDLLWVYEGLTRYYGDFVLATRSGLLSPEDARAYLGFLGAQMDEDRPGRQWRPLADTATAAPAFADAPAAWGALQPRGPTITTRCC